MVVRVLPAQQGRAGGAAEGIGDEVIIEGHALVLDQSLRLRHESVARDILVIGEDEYDVGALLARLDRRRAGDRRTHTASEDRKSVVQGKSVSVRVDLGGRRSLKNKQTVAHDRLDVSDM